MIQQNSTHNTTKGTKASRRVDAERCAHCGRALPTGEGTDVPYVGAVGPECLQKYGGLLAALEAADGMQGYEWDEGSLRLCHRVIWDLRSVGVAVAVIDVRAGVKALEVRGLSKKPRQVVASFEQIRAEFERRLQLAAAEREADGSGWVA